MWKIPGLLLRTTRIGGQAGLIELVYAAEKPACGADDFGWVSVVH